MRKYRKPLVITGSLLGVALIVALLVVMLGNRGAATTPNGTISSPIGEVLVQKQGSTTWIQAVSGMKLYEGDRLKTGGNSTTEIVFFEGSVVDVSADSEVLLNELAVAPHTGSTSIHLKQLVGNTVNRVQKLVDSASNMKWRPRQARLWCGGLLLTPMSALMASPLSIVMRVLSGSPPEG